MLEACSKVDERRGVTTHCTQERMSTAWGRLFDKRPCTRWILD
jgi:hypothetical protein